MYLPITEWPDLNCIIFLCGYNRRTNHMTSGRQSVQRVIEAQLSPWTGHRLDGGGAGARCRPARDGVGAGVVND
jgi:hypothetical protein